MEKYNHYTYCEDIARKLKPILHTNDKKQFFKATGQDDIDELNERLSEASGMLFIAIDETESVFDWQNSDSLMEQPVFLFAIVKQTEIGNSSTIFQAQQECKNTALQVIYKMMDDYHEHVNGMDLLEPSSFRMKGFGPLRENFYGVLVGFSFNQGINYILNPDLWV